MQNFANALNGFHVLFFVLGVLAQMWLWYRSGCWIPRYVHMIAIAAFIAGVFITATLPPPRNPDWRAQLTFPIFFPLLGYVATYVIAVGAGFVRILTQNGIHKNTTDPRDDFAESPSHTTGQRSL